MKAGLSAEQIASMWGSSVFTAQPCPRVLKVWTEKMEGQLALVCCHGHLVLARESL